MDKTTQDELVGYGIILLTIGSAAVVVAALIVGFFFGIGYGLIVVFAAIMLMLLRTLYVCRKKAKAVKKAKEEAE